MMCLRVVRDAPDDGPTVHFQVKESELANHERFLSVYLQPALHAIRNRLHEQRVEEAADLCEPSDPQ